MYELKDAVRPQQMRAADIRSERRAFRPKLQDTPAKDLNTDDAIRAETNAMMPRGPAKGARSP
jgi:hypothetical protein